MTVTIRRDDWGVPHVDAPSEREGFFGVGYAQAEDHLEGLLTTYAVLGGRGADALGARGALLDASEFRWRHLELSRAALPGLPAPVRVAHEAFVAGVRAYLDAHPEEVPDWLPSLEPALPLAVYRMHLWPRYMVGDALDALIAAGISIDEQVLREFAAVDPTGGAASNAAFLAAERTADGGAVLLSDPHGSITGFPMSEVRLRAGELDLVGVCAVGAALPILGHTRQLAWAMTTGAPRVSDAYGFGNPSIVRRTGVHGVVEEVVHNGVPSAVVARDQDRTYVTCTPYAASAGVMECELYRLLTARTAAEGRDALRTLGMFPQNVLVVDAAGRSVYVRTGRTPIRAPHVDVSRPVDGDDATTTWQGLHPLDDLVQVADPPCGWFQCDNVAPDATYDGAVDGPLRADRYPSYVFNDEPGRTHGRAERHKELLRAAVRADAEQLRGLATDDYWPGTVTWQQALRAAAGSAGDAPSGRVQTLLRFDGFARPESSEALAWWYWRTTLAAAGVETPDDPDQLLRAVDAAVERMQADGAVGATYGERFRIGVEGVSYPGRGGSFPGETAAQLVQHAEVVSAVRMMLFGPPDDAGIRWAHTGGRSLRLVQFTEPIRSQSVVLFGQSTRPGSPHRSDQAELYSQARLRSTYFDEEELREHVVTTAQLDVPEGIAGG